MGDMKFIFLNVITNISKKKNLVRMMRIWGLFYELFNSRDFRELQHTDVIGLLKLIAQKIHMYTMCTFFCPCKLGQRRNHGYQNFSYIYISSMEVGKKDIFKP